MPLWSEGGNQTIQGYPKYLRSWSEVGPGLSAITTQRANSMLVWLFLFVWLRHKFHQWNRPQRPWQTSPSRCPWWATPCLACRCVCSSRDPRTAGISAHLDPCPVGEGIQKVKIWSWRCCKHLCHAWYHGHHVPYEIWSLILEIIKLVHSFYLNWSGSKTFTLTSICHNTVPWKNSWSHRWCHPL